MTRYEEIEKALKWVAGQENLFFAECSQAEEIIARARAALALPEDSKTVNAELYGLAVELADSAARSDIECLCDFNEEAVCTWYFLNGSGQEYAEDISRAARYISLREASGEPMPYKVVREGDRVRFE